MLANDKETNEKISKIIKYEWEITNAVRAGHKPFWGDEYRDKRNEIIKLRKELNLLKLS